jgi:hypothetical protein
MVKDGSINAKVEGINKNEWKKRTNIWKCSKRFRKNC